MPFYVKLSSQSINITICYLLWVCGVFEYLPAVTIATGGGLVAFLLSRGMVKEQMHRFLLLFLVFASLYALFDILFFTAPTRELAILLAKLDLSLVYFMTISLVLFCYSLERELGGKEIALFMAFFVFLLVIWGGLVDGVLLRSWGWQVVYDMDLFMIWGFGLLIPFLMAIASLWRIDRKLREKHSGYEIRIRAIMMGFILLVAFGQINVVGEVALDAVPPLYSTTLSLPIIIITWTIMEDRN